MSDRPDDNSQRTVNLSDGTSVRLCHERQSLCLKFRPQGAGTWYEASVDASTWGELISAAATILDYHRDLSAPRLRAA